MLLHRDVYYSDVLSHLLNITPRGHHTGLILPRGVITPRHKYLRYVRSDQTRRLLRGTNIRDMFAPIRLGDLGIFHTVIRFDKTEMSLYLDDLPLLGRDECPRCNSEMFQNPRVFEVNFIPNTFDGTNYGYWKARMRFFLKSIDCWSIVETGWTKPEDATLELVPQKNARLSNDKALHALCQALSPSEFAKISNSELAKEAWQILETTYEGTKLVKSAKLQMLISKFEEIKMLEDETFGEFYSKMSDLKNSMVSLGKPISDVKLIRKILTSFPERFRIMVITTEESKDIEEMKIEELVGSLQMYELSLPPVKKLKTIALKSSKKKVKASSEDDSEEEEKAVAMLAKNF